MARSYTLNKSPRKGSGIDFKAELNDQQYAAVTAKPGQQLVIAGRRLWKDSHAHLPGRLFIR